MKKLIILLGFLFLVSCASYGGGNGSATDEPDDDWAEGS